MTSKSYFLGYLKVIKSYGAILSQDLFIIKLRFNVAMFAWFSVILYIIDCPQDIVTRALIYYTL